MSPYVKLRAASRDYEEAKQSLEKENRIHDAKKKIIEQEWERLKWKEIVLSEGLRKNDKVIKNNKKVLEKQKNKMAEEFEGERRIEEELKYLEEELSLCETTKTMLKERISMLRIYEDFLQHVVEEYSMYSVIDDVQIHYEYLIETRLELKELLWKNVKLIERVRKEVEDITKEGVILIFNLSKNLHRFRMEECLSQKDLSHWTQILKNLQDTDNMTNQEITVAIEGVWLLYLNMCRAWNKCPQLKKNELQVVLDFIVEHLSLIKSILEESQNYLSQPNLESKEVEKWELNKWSADYEGFLSGLSKRPQPS